MNGESGNIRRQLLEAAVPFVRSAARLGGVTRIALVGSIVTDRPRPKDIDLLVSVTDAADLSQVAALARRLQGRLQGVSLGADVFLASEAGEYLGRTCVWKVCRPGVRASCDAVHCGRRPYLHDDLGAVTLNDALVVAPPVELWPAVVRRVELPSDVEEFVTHIHEPHNYTLHLTSGVGPAPT